MAEERRYTDLDLLKQITAQGLISTGAVEKVLARFKEQNPNSTNADIDLAIRHADVVKAQLMLANGERVVRSDDPEHYSDGRTVVGTVDCGGSEYKYVWYADPEHPYNHPAADQPAVAEVPDSNGRLWKVFVAESHKLGCYELGDEEQDRL
jgi:hypothetical protein